MGERLRAGTLPGRSFPDDRIGSHRHPRVETEARQGGRLQARYDPGRVGIPHKTHPRLTVHQHGRGSARDTSPPRRDSPLRLWSPLHRESDSLPDPKAPWLRTRAPLRRWAAGVGQRRIRTRGGTPRITEVQKRFGIRVPAEETMLAGWNRILAVNLTGAFREARRRLVRATNVTPCTRSRPMGKGPANF